MSRSVRAFFTSFGVVVLLLLLAGEGRTASNPLSPPDATSPRASIATFRSHAQEAEKIAWDAANEIKYNKNFFWDQKTYNEARRARQELDRAARVLDLSQVTPAVFERKKVESVLLLNEILDRVPLPADDEIPNDTKADSYTIPGTEIRLVKVKEGPNAGEYFFSADTIARLPEFYQKIRYLPSLYHAPLDYFQYYSHSPGGLIPPAWFHQVQTNVPFFGTFMIGEQAAWQWIAVIVAALILISLVRWAGRIGRWLSAKDTPILSILGAMALPAAIWMASEAFEFVFTQANITGFLYEILDIFMTGVSYLASSWMIMAAALRTADIAHLWMKGQNRFSIDASLTRTLIRVVGFIAAIAILAQGLSELGVPFMGIIAGLGIGGLAIALAAQPTIENLIGGVMLYLDRPVRVGDWCEFGEHRGVVEEIGLRSTRIRTRDKTLITVTNADFAKMKIINLSRGDRGVVRLSLNFPYDMPVETLEKLLAEMRAYLASHTVVDETSTSVHLSDLSNSNAKVDIAAEIIVPPDHKLSPIREELLLGLARIADRYDGRRMGDFRAKA